MSANHVACDRSCVASASRTSDGAPTRNAALTGDEGVSTEWQPRHERRVANDERPTSIDRLHHGLDRTMPTDRSDAASPTPTATCSSAYRPAELHVPTEHARRDALSRAR